jgi:glycosyltransferase involved in cell wall biosynthesis
MFTAARKTGAKQTMRPNAARRVSNILLTCSDDAGNGGVQVVFRDLVQSLEGQGRNVYLLYQSSITRPRLRQGVNAWGRLAFYCSLPTLLKRSTFSLPIALACIPLVIFNLWRLVRRHRIDVINAHYLAEYFVHLALIARLLRLPFVVSVHGADVDRYASCRPVERLLLRLIMRGAHRIVACSRAMADETARVFPVARSKITYVHNGLGDLPAALPPATAPVPFVLCVSRQVAKKGVDTLLRAFVYVRREVPGVALVVVGDGPELRKHRALVEALGITDAVKFFGNRARDDVLPLFAACSVFVLPSRAEPFGVVLLEAAYYKRPIVCTAVGGVPEIITDGVNGYLVAPDDPEEMAEKIQTLLRQPGLAERFGGAAHETVRTRFRWEDRVQDYVTVYEDAQAAGGCRPRSRPVTSPTADERSPR